MGQLVFQATLGGAINLSGPNTASTVTFTLPSADGSSGQVMQTNGAGLLSLGNVSLTSAVTGTLPVANGGTGTTTSTGTGSVMLNSAPSVTNPTVTNYTETLYTANTSTAITVSLANGTVQQLTLTGNATITMPTASAGKSFIIMLKQDGTGSRTVTWSTVVWGGGTAPTITSTASKQDIYSFFSDGTNWYGATIGQNY